MYRCELLQTVLLVIINMYENREKFLKVDVINVFVLKCSLLEMYFIRTKRTQVMLYKAMMPCDDTVNRVL